MSFTKRNQGSLEKWLIPDLGSWERNVQDKPGTSHYKLDSKNLIKDNKVTSKGRCPALPWVVPKHLKHTAAGHIWSQLEEPPTNQSWDNIIPWIETHQIYFK